jgi:hypothetical protein
MWKHFTIHYDTMPELATIASEDCSAVPDLIGYLVTDGEVATLGKDEAVCVLCPRAFLYPNLREVSCADLDTVVSPKMDVTGGTLLHEMFHWNYLITPFSEGEELVDWEPDPPDWPAPPDGYNPYNAMQINRLSTEPEKLGSVQPNPVRNPDNYVWFALEAWWRKMCPHGVFGEALPLPPGAEHPK